jgi:hypothetical protein
MSINDSDDVSMPLLSPDDLTKVKSQINALTQEQEENKPRVNNRFRGRSMRLPKMEETGGEESFVKITMVEYSRNKMEKKDTYSVERCPADMSDWSTVRWIHCEGISPLLYITLLHKDLTKRCLMGSGVSLIYIPLLLKMY